jgi:hypothetical protein
LCPIEAIQRFLESAKKVCLEQNFLFVSSKGVRHGLAGSAIPNASYVIASQGEMADAMGFSVE